MTVKTLLKRLRKDDLFGSQIRIKKINSAIRGRCFLNNERSLEGRTGTLTNIFAGFTIKGIGIFLDGIDNLKDAPDCCNLDATDEIDLLLLVSKSEE